MGYYLRPVKPTLEIADPLDFPEYLPTVVNWIQTEWPDRHRTGATVEERLVGKREKGKLPAVLIALNGKSIVGYASLVLWADGVKKGQPHWIDGLYVEPGMRGHGIASLLIRSAEAKARELGISRLLALTEIPRLYEKAGWKPSGIVVTHPEDTIMEKTL